jgi:hypothetical protein
MPCISHGERFGVLGNPIAGEHLDTLRRSEKLKIKLEMQSKLFVQLHEAWRCAGGG